MRARCTSVRARFGFFIWGRGGKGTKEDHTYQAMQLVEDVQTGEILACAMVTIEHDGVLVVLVHSLPLGFGDADCAACGACDYWPSEEDAPVRGEAHRP